MEYEEIKKALLAHGYTWSVAADAMAVRPQHVMNVASRRSESHRVAQNLSTLIGKTVEEVFPDIPRYSTTNKAETRQSKIEQAKSLLEQSQLAS